MNALPWTAHLELPAEPTSVAYARRATVRILEGWYLDRLADTATLLVSELVTNAIKTAKTFRRGTGHDADEDARTVPAGPLNTGARRILGSRNPDDVVPVNKENLVTLQLCFNGAAFTIEVWDPSRECLPVLRDVSAVAESGRGILLVTALSRQWGSYAPRAGGKVVWCEIPAALRRDTGAGAAEPAATVRTGLV